jgi:hypothetical protein
MAIDVSTILNEYDEKYFLFRLAGAVDLATGQYYKISETFVPFFCHDQPATADEIRVLPEGLRGDEIRKIYTSHNIDVLTHLPEVTVETQLVSDGNDRNDLAAMWWRLYAVKRYGRNRHYKAMMVPMDRADVERTLGAAPV